MPIQFYSIRGLSEDIGVVNLRMSARVCGVSISSSRCTCGQCDDANLSSALEYRCCREIEDVSTRLVQEGRQELCITRHSDFNHLVNRTVLEQVAPLLKDKNGRSYRRRRNQTEDE